MRGRAALIVGLGTGYVLGTRAGRERYEQIKTRATGLWHDPRVQEKAAQVQDVAKEKAPQVQQKVTDAAKKATGAAKETASSVETATGDGARATLSDPPTVASPDPAGPVAAEPTPGTHPVTGHA
jgi:oxygen-dependent protoporphyrinogen oxidase